MHSSSVAATAARKRRLRFVRRANKIVFSSKRNSNRSFGVDCAVSTKNKQFTE